MQHMLLQQNFKLYQSLRTPAPSAPILFYRVNISGLKIRLVLKKSQNISWSTRTWKADIETGHYNWREKLYPLISLTKFWICLWYWICEGTEYTMVTQCSDYVWICLNNFWISQIMAEYTRICLIMPEYAWICLNIYLNGFWFTCLHYNPCQRLVFTKRWWSYTNLQLKAAGLFKLNDLLVGTRRKMVTWFCTCESFFFF